MLSTVSGSLVKMFDGSTKQMLKRGRKPKHMA